MICRKIIWKRSSCDWWKYQTCYSFHFLGFLITDLTLKWPNSTAKLPTTTFKSHSTTRRTTTSCYTTTCAKPTAKSATTATWATNRCKRRWREKKRKHEIDGLMIKVNVSLIYGVKNKICWTFPDVIKFGVALKLK